MDSNIIVVSRVGTVYVNQVKQAKGEGLQVRLRTRAGVVTLEGEDLAQKIIGLGGIELRPDLNADGLQSWQRRHVKVTGNYSRETGLLTVTDMSDAPLANVGMTVDAFKAAVKDAPVAAARVQPPAPAPVAPAEASDADEERF